ncbi:hypothetical protein [Adlercreutzia sp. ZJ242]|uniref:hypothetical protein n=1 Tax=Adlercreutzia sp. ZJ242 TaxID=2709409 RepID=UPI0013E99F4D|nr:hypothetical protein [Adlercreutzia sp. ZJ242]
MSTEPLYDATEGIPPDQSEATEPEGQAPDGINEELEQINRKLDLILSTLQG